MAYKVASEYPHGVDGVNFAVDQGAFVKDDRFKNGGDFESPVKDGDYLALDPTVAWGVKKAGAEDMVIGVAAGKPFGPIEGQAIAVKMFGSMILDMPIAKTASAVGIGDCLKFAGGELTNVGEGESSAFIALDAVADPSVGVSIPVLCGYYGGPIL